MPTIHKAHFSPTCMCHTPANLKISQKCKFISEILHSIEHLSIHLVLKQTVRLTLPNHFLSTETNCFPTPTMNECVMSELCIMFILLQCHHGTYTYIFNIASKNGKHAKGLNSMNFLNHIGL